MKQTTDTKGSKMIYDEATRNPIPAGSLADAIYESYSPAEVETILTDLLSSYAHDANHAAMGVTAQRERIKNRMSKLVYIATGLRIR